MTLEKLGINLTDLVMNSDIILDSDNIEIRNKLKEHLLNIDNLIKEFESSDDLNYSLGSRNLIDNSILLIKSILENSLDNEYKNDITVEELLKEIGFDSEQLNNFISYIDNYQTEKSELAKYILNGGKNIIQSEIALKIINSKISPINSNKTFDFIIGYAYEKDKVQLAEIVLKYSTLEDFELEDIIKDDEKLKKIALNIIKNKEINYYDKIYLNEKLKEIIETSTIHAYLAYTNIKEKEYYILKDGIKKGLDEKAPACYADHLAYIPKIEELMAKFITTNKNFTDKSGILKWLEAMDMIKAMKDSGEYEGYFKNMGMTNVNKFSVATYCNHPFGLAGLNESSTKNNFLNACRNLEKEGKISTEDLKLINTYAQNEMVNEFLKKGKEFYNRYNQMLKIGTIGENNITTFSNNWELDINNLLNNIERITCVLSNVQEKYPNISSIKNTFYEIYNNIKNTYEENQRLHSTCNLNLDIIEKINKNFESIVLNNLSLDLELPLNNVTTKTQSFLLLKKDSNNKEKFDLIESIRNGKEKPVFNSRFRTNYSGQSLDNNNTTVSLLLSLSYNGVISVERYTEMFKMKVDQCENLRTKGSSNKSLNMNKNRIEAISNYFYVFKDRLNDPNVNLKFIFKSFIESKDILSNLDNFIETKKNTWKHTITGAKELKALIENHKKLENKKNYKP